MIYKAIIFDLGKVLVHFDFQKAYRTLEGRCPYPSSDIPKRLGGTDLVQRFETGLVEPAAFVDELSRHLDLDLGYDGFCEVWSSIFGPPLVPESLLEGLAARYRLLLLSNTNAIHFESIRRNYAPLLRHFHHLILSYEVKAMKPQPEIYRVAIARAECLPGECFFTDDVPQYVEGARREGIDAVQFRSAEVLEEELRSRGISW